MNCAVSVVEIGLAEITGFTVQSDAQLCATLGLSEFDMHVIAVDRLLKQLDRLFGTQTSFHRMIPLAKPLDEALFLWSVGVWRIRRGRRIFRHLLHLLSETEGSHIRPHFLNESQTIAFQSDFSYVLPA